MKIREQLENFQYDSHEQIRIIAERLFRTRPRAEVKLYPYIKNVAQHVDVTMSAAMEHVDLRKVFKNVNEGQVCFVSFCVSSSTEDDGYIKISSNTDVYVDQRKVYVHGSCNEEYVLIPLHVSNQRQRVDIKCYCRKEDFSFDYLLSSKVYSFMWAVDYLLHIKRTLPIEEYRNEEGIAISSIYPADVYEDEYRQLVEGWGEGLSDLLVYKGKNNDLDEMILMAQTVLCQYESAYHHIQFVNRRNKMLENAVSSAEEKEKLQCEILHIVRDEMETVQTLIDLRLQDSRIGFESSNHYFYTLQDLKEKMINLAYCEEQLSR